MINKNELRIGNLLEYNEGGICIITEINEFGLSVKFPEEETYMEYSEFSAIPLTEEILLKCGFELKGVIFRINNGFTNQFDVNYSLSRNIYYYDSSKYGIYNEVELKYIHQIQNILYINI